MAKVCHVTGKRRQVGNNVSHSQRKTKRTFEPNLHWRRFWVPGLSQFIKLRVSHRALRTIDKLGIEAVLTKLMLEQLN